jgi:hypothetical protein
MKLVFGSSFKSLFEGMWTGIMELALIADKNDVIERISKGSDIGRWIQDDLELM